MEADSPSNDSVFFSPRLEPNSLETFFVGYSTELRFSNAHPPWLRELVAISIKHYLIEGP